MLLAILALALAENTVLIDQNCVQTHYHYKLVPCDKNTPVTAVTVMALLPLEFTDGCYTAYGDFSLSKSGEGVTVYDDLACSGTVLASTLKETTTCFAVGSKSFAVIYDTEPNYCPQDGLLATVTHVSHDTTCSNITKTVDVYTTTKTTPKFDPFLWKNVSIRLFVERDGDETLQLLDTTVDAHDADNHVVTEVKCAACTSLQNHRINLDCWKYHDAQCEVLIEPNNCFRMADAAATNSVMFAVVLVVGLLVML